MKTNRRDFIKTLAVGTALAGIGGISNMCTSKPKITKMSNNNKAVLNISFQESTAPQKELNAKLDYMEKLGVTGLEPGGANLTNRINEFQQALRNRNIKISAICAGFGGWLLADDPAVKEECIRTSKEILAAAGELGSVGMILAPAFNYQKSFPHTLETRERLADDLRMLGEFAYQHNTSLILEPLNRREAFYLRQLADAASICRDVNSPGIACMGDFWHMTFEETSDHGAFISGGDYLKHVHIASRKRRSMPGEDGDADNYIDGFKGLKALNYPGYISFECGSKGDKAVTIPAAVKLIREQWEMA
ncbi:MAG: TIM barrel protein [Prevotellaceae bacterium]|jgi:sugar phosphate isomerase/epimerase|nr:TIM barrel protein [Prevotellaceae bacterium]